MQQDINKVLLGGVCHINCSVDCKAMPLSLGGDLFSSHHSLLEMPWEATKSVIVC